MQSNMTYMLNIKGHYIAPPPQRLPSPPPAVTPPEAQTSKLFVKNECINVNNADLYKVPTDMPEPGPSLEDDNIREMSPLTSAPASIPMSDRPDSPSGAYEENEDEEDIALKDRAKSK